MKITSSIKITPVGVYKSCLVAAAWYFYGFGAAILVFLAWLQIRKGL